MDCAAWRLDISARLDGEPSERPQPELDAHLAGCAGCRAHALRVVALQDRLASTLATPPPSRRAELLAAMAATRRSQARRLDRWRLGLLVVAVTQLALAAPALVLGDGGGASTHVARHLGAWDVALAIGFLVAVIQPVRSIGLLPMAAAVAGCMVAAAVLDVATGHASALGETVHLLELAGLALLWLLSRSVPRPTAPAVGLAAT